LTFSAGMHAALVPEHLREMPALGWSFVAAALIGAVIAYAMIAKPDDGRWLTIAGVFLAAEVVAWILFVTVRVPGFTGTPEAVEVIALVCKAVELGGLALVIHLARDPQREMVATHPARHHPIASEVRAG
jgi:hypothetical protein